MSHNYENDWENVKNSTYDVVLDQNGRGASYEETVAGTLGVKAQYLNWLQVGANTRLPLYEKVAEILDLWKDDKNAARASRFDFMKRYVHNSLACLKEINIVQRYKITPSFLTRI